MINPETTNTIKQGLEDIGHRLSIIQEGKNSIIDLLNNLEENYKILMKIRTNQIITKKEHKNITDYIHKCAYQSRPADILNIIKPKDIIDHSKTIREIYPFVKDYPFVVDADEVREDISRLLEDGIAEIRKNGKRGLVKKAKGPDGKDTIQTLFDYNHSQWGVLTFSQEEYEKYGIVEVRDNHTDSRFTHDTMFLQRVEDPKNGSTRYFQDLGRYTISNNFDKDNIGFIKKGKGVYSLLHKDPSSEGKKIYEIMFTLESTIDDVTKGFDSFNTFETEIKKYGKVIFKKSYDDSGKLIGIYAFKKKRFGGEEQIRARDKEH